LASAFFPDAGRHKLVLYPQLFAQSKEEQVETLIHEIGHVFGLRHFFAKLSEAEWASEIFGKHKPVSIMNYGPKSQLTSEDKADLRRLYQMVWAGEMTQINGTPIRLVKPFHTTAITPENMVTVGQVQTVFPAQPGVTHLSMT
ncbi:MAG: matrix metalloproteinase-11, partial [Pyrinomonadaceae bacterium]|nr:matrix metalloproteinase-11 [Pyrinomonadaceae bacterium]